MPGFPGRATDAGAGILSPATTTDPDIYWWETAKGRPSTIRICWGGWRPMASTPARAGYATCGLLSVGLRAHEDDWFAAIR
jgi:hypothetical protein